MSCAIRIHELKLFLGMQMSACQLCLTKKQVVTLYCYYGLLILIGIFILYCYIVTDKNISIDMFSLLVSSQSAGILGSSSCYIRKLYRDGLNSRFKEEPLITGDCIHTFIYYMFRPIFAAISSFFIVIGIQQGFFLLSASSELNSPNFFYLSIFVSFLVGFNVARMFGIFNKENIVL